MLACRGFLHLSIDGDAGVVDGCADWRLGGHWYFNRQIPPCGESDDGGGKADLDGRPKAEQSDTVVALTLAD